MNRGRGWNPDLEESYLLEYSEYEDESFTNGTSEIYLRPVNVSSPGHSPISRYGEIMKINSFGVLGFSRLKP